MPGGAAAGTNPPMKKNEHLSLELQYKVLFDRKNTRQVLAWGVPGILIAAELALLPRVFEARTLGQLASSGVASSLLGLLSYQLFNHHKYKKQLDERWLLRIEEQSPGALLLHAPYSENRFIDGDQHERNPYERDSWFHRVSATFVWNAVMLAGAGLPIIVTVFRAKRIKGLS